MWYFAHGRTRCKSIIGSIFALRVLFYSSDITFGMQLNTPHSQKRHYPLTWDTKDLSAASSWSLIGIGSHWKTSTGTEAQQFRLSTFQTNFANLNIWKKVFYVRGLKGNMAGCVTPCLSVNGASSTRRDHASSGKSRFNEISINNLVSTCFSYSLYALIMHYATIISHTCSNYKYIYMTRSAHVVQSLSVSDDTLLVFISMVSLTFRDSSIQVSRQIDLICQDTWD